MSESLHYVDTVIGAQHSEMARTAAPFEEKTEGSEGTTVIATDPSVARSSSGDERENRRRMFEMHRMNRARMYQMAEMNREKRREREALYIILGMATIGLLYGGYCMYQNRKK